MGQCCGFVKSDKSHEQTNKEEQYKEIEQAIKKMEDGDKKNQLLRELNQRGSLIYSKESYQDILDIKHKIYEGPNKNKNQQENADSELKVKSNNEIKIDSKNCDATQQQSELNNSNIQENNNTNQENQNQNQNNNVESTTHIDSKQNALKDKQPSKNLQSDLNVKIASNNSNNIKSGNSKQDLHLSDIQIKDNNNKTPDKSPTTQEKKQPSPEKSAEKKQQDQQQQQQKQSDQKPTRVSLKQANSQKDGGGGGGEKNVVFDIEEIDKEMKKAGKYRAGEHAMTEYDNQSTTKTEKQVKSVLKKYSDVQSCYTKDGEEGKKSSKKKKVKFKDPQKAKKKPPKRNFH